MYKRARKGEIKQFTGIDDVYEVPSKPELTIDTGNTTLEYTTGYVLEYLESTECL